MKTPESEHHVSGIDVMPQQRVKGTTGTAVFSSDKSLHEVGPALQGFPSAQDGCDVDCHYCQGPETD